jgi:predicted phage-related endonuclease
VLDLEQGTEEWLEWRHSGIGVSEAWTVMGDNRFQSPSELLYQKKHKIDTELNEKMRLGTSLEPDARGLYIEHNHRVADQIEE